MFPVNRLKMLLPGQMVRSPFHKIMFGNVHITDDDVRFCYEPGMLTEMILNIRTPKKMCCNHSKVWTMWVYHRAMSPNDADGMANSVDPDQTAPLGAVWSGSALFAQAYLSENLGSIRYTWNPNTWLCAETWLLIACNTAFYAIIFMYLSCIYVYCFNPEARTVEQGGKVPNIC